MTHLKILSVDARYPGAQHDAYIWNAFAARRVMERAYNRGERRIYLISNLNFLLKMFVVQSFYFVDLLLT